MTVCLDAWAVVAWLQNDPAASRMQAHVGDSRCCMSWVNAGEVHYVVHRRTDRHTADRVIAQLRVDVDLIDATGARALDAAAIKATHRMSYADCFAAATALEQPEVKARLAQIQLEVTNVSAEAAATYGLAR